MDMREMASLAYPTFNLADSGSFVGRELGVSEWITIDQGRIDQFAACTGDHQWLHVDVERSRRELVDASLVDRDPFGNAELAPH